MPSVEGPCTSPLSRQGWCLQGFLTAVLQNHARLTQTPIDQLSFGFDVLAIGDALQLATPPEIGVCVSGLHLEGARYVAAAMLPGTDSSFQSAIGPLPSQALSLEMNNTLPVHQQTFLQSALFNRQ